MASPGKDGAEKYKDLSEDELRKECEKRKLDLSGVFLKDSLISLLTKDDMKPTDWGVVYARLLDAGLRYEDIPKRTLPQIEAILGEWANLISVRIPSLFGGGSSEEPEQQKPGEPPKVSQFAAFANMFNGIR